MAANTTERTCACKGIRTCLLCENENERRNSSKEGEENPVQVRKAYYFCHICDRAFHDDSPSDHPAHGPAYTDFSGIELYPDFITEQEESELVSQIYQTVWVDSQSGRRKQDFGPKANFKKKKLKTGIFTGLPPYAKWLYERMQGRSLLQDFTPVELCNLEYDPLRGASIDPHFDDFWLWGERLVTLNMLSSTYLSMTLDDQPDVEILVAMPARSLMVVYGDARYKWKHGIHRNHLKSKRLAMTWRELTKEFMPGGTNEKCGQDLIQKALGFNGVSVGTLSQQKGEPINNI